MWDAGKVFVSSVTFVLDLFISFIHNPLPPPIPAHSFAIPIPAISFSKRADKMTIENAIHLFYRLPFVFQRIQQTESSESWANEGIKGDIIASQVLTGMTFEETMKRQPQETVSRRRCRRRKAISVERFAVERFFVPVGLRFVVCVFL